MITDFVNKIAEGLQGLTVAGTALSTAIIGCVMFWRSTAKLIPTEWKNPVIDRIFKTIHLIARCLGADFPDIAYIDWRHFRVVTRAELMATKVVNAAVIPQAVIVNPPPPAEMGRADV